MIIINSDTSYDTSYFIIDPLQERLYINKILSAADLDPYPVFVEDELDDNEEAYMTIESCSLDHHGDFSEKALYDLRASIFTTQDR